MMVVINTRNFVRPLKYRSSNRSRFHF